LKIIGSQQLSQAEKHSTDAYGRVLLNERKICDQLYVNPDLDVSRIALENPMQYNSAIQALYLEWPQIQQLAKISQEPSNWHQQNQRTWFIPEEYQNLDIARWVLDQCANSHELQRAGQELLMFSERDQLCLLKYLKYLVDTMRNNNIVWGVGRGSSVASFVLYLIGVHKIHSLHHNLDIEEFLK